MAIDAAQARNIQHRLRQYQPVGDHDEQVWFERRQFRLCFFITQAGWLEHR